MNNDKKYETVDEKFEKARLEDAKNLIFDRVMICLKENIITHKEACAIVNKECIFPIDILEKIEKHKECCSEKRVDSDKIKFRFKDIDSFEDSLRGGIVLLEEQIKTVQELKRSLQCYGDMREEKRNLPHQEANDSRNERHSNFDNRLKTLHSNFDEFQRRLQELEMCFPLKGK